MLATLRNVFEEYPGIVGDVTPEQWLALPKNILYAKDGSVALFTYEYPGVYSGHWFFKARGRGAIDLAHEFLQKLFAETDAQAIRGLVRLDLLGSRWMARKIGLTSYGIIEIKNKFYELFCITRKEYNG